MKKTLIALTALLFLSGCGGSGKSESAASYNSAAGGSYNTYYETDDMEDAVAAAAPYEEEMKAADEGVGTVTTARELAKTEEKIVYTGSLSIETKHYEETVKTLNEKVSGYGGLISSSDENARYSGMRTMYLTVRIPSASFHDFMGGAAELGNIRSQSTSRNDITRQYNDRTIEAEALATQEVKLLEMLEKAATVEEMLMIEDRLIQVQTKLNQLRSVIDNMDLDVAYSTVNIYLDEVVQYSSDVVERKDETFTDRLQNALEDSYEITRDVLEGVFFTLIRYAPLLLIGGLLIWLYRRFRKTHPAKPFRLFGRKKKDSSPE